MSASEVLEIGTAVLVSIGGAGLVLFGLSSWLGKVWAERILTKEKQKYTEDLEEFKQRLAIETESHKVKLKKSEFMFSKEYEAASKLVSINRDISPNYSHPEMDWYDACDHMALDFEKTERILHQFLKEHGAILPAGVKNLITISYGIASKNKFGTENGEVLTDANAYAEIMHGHLKQAEFEMIQQIQAQVST